MIVHTGVSLHPACGPWVSAIGQSPQHQPWQNGIAERLIGKLRRECLDQMVIVSEAHLRQILSAYEAIL
jgi:hypothetical protein